MLSNMDPMQIAKSLLDAAREGDELLLAVRDYEIVKELGRGGMGAVFLLRHTGIGERVALKLMLPRIAAVEAAKKQFRREAENMIALDHPHVVKLRHWIFLEGVYFFTLEYCDGGSVSDLMQNRLIENGDSRLTIDEAMPIILQALDGLDYAHHAIIPQVKLKDGSYDQGRGLVHRDISPSNLFLCGTGETRATKVGDYGLAKAFDLAGLSGLTEEGAAQGKPAFMPVQQVENYLYAKPDVDIWAMAATLYNMLTGYYPRNFPSGRNPWVVVQLDKVVPIRKRDAGVPRGLADVIDYALIERPEIPFKSAADFKRALQNAL